MHYVGCGQTRAVVKPDILSHVKHPVVGVLDFPTFSQHPFVLALVEIISTETAHNLTPDSVQQRDAVAIGVIGLHGLGDAYGNSGLRETPGRIVKQRRQTRS
jgi:hypothetical protein